MTDLRSPSPFDPATFLLLAKTLGSTQAHEVELASTQQDHVRSDTLPKEGLDDLVRFGVEILGPVSGDDLIMYVKLPTGWKQQATKHSMWSELLDEQGRRRAMLFRGPFYDRGDHLDVEPKYAVRTDFEHKEQTGEVIARVRCAGEVVFSTVPRKGHAGRLDVLSEEQRRANFELGDVAEAEAIAWVTGNFPEWKNRHAYW